MTKYLISKTAIQRGFGTDCYKSVSFLTAAERVFIRSGGKVFFESSALSGGNFGTYWRVCLDKKKWGIAPRVPTDAEIKMLEDLYPSGKPARGQIEAEIGPIEAEIMRVREMRCL